MRLASIIAGYLSAALVGTLVLMIGFALMGDPVFSQFGMMLGLFLPAALILAAPVGVPGIIYSELRKSGGWRLFAATGVAIELLICVFIMNTFEPFEIAYLLVAATAASLTYWLVSWHLFPPRIATASPTGSSE